MKVCTVIVVLLTFLFFCSNGTNESSDVHFVECNDTCL